MKKIAYALVLTLGFVAACKKDTKKDEQAQAATMTAEKKAKALADLGCVCKPPAPATTTTTKPAAAATTTTTAAAPAQPLLDCAPDSVGLEPKVVQCDASYSGDAAKCKDGNATDTYRLDQCKATYATPVAAPAGAPPA